MDFATSGCCHFFHLVWEDSLYHWVPIYLFAIYFVMLQNINIKNLKIREQGFVIYFLQYIYILDFYKTLIALQNFWSIFPSRIFVLRYLWMLSSLFSFYCEFKTFLFQVYPLLHIIWRGLELPLPPMVMGQGRTHPLLYHHPLQVPTYILNCWFFIK